MQFFFYKDILAKNFNSFNLMKKIIFLLGFFFLFFTVQAEEKKRLLTSQGKQFVLIELFTSQGCSSCPPAEKWLNQFKENKDLWEKYIPIAFHVDYWNYLGWKDPYSKTQATKRQKRYRRERKVRSVYTPGVVVNGKEWRGGSLSALKNKQKNNNHFLQASIQNNKIIIAYKGDKKNLAHKNLAQKNLTQKNLQLHFVLLGFGIKTQVKAGENARKTLPQEFVVLEYLKMDSKTGSWSFDLPSRNYKEVKKYAVAMWVNEKGDLKPIQAIGSWL